jgi:hypothetical protein
VYEDFPLSSIKLIIIHQKKCLNKQFVDQKCDSILTLFFFSFSFFNL